MMKKEIRSKQTTQLKRLALFFMPFAAMRRAFIFEGGWALETTLKTVVTSLGAVISWLVGGWSLLLTVLLIFNALDFITGMAANWGTISSSTGYKGIIKKGMMWVWVVAANLIYRVLLDGGYSIGEVIPNSVTILFIINELISLGENSAKLGLNMPSPIVRALEIFNTKGGDKK